METKEILGYIIALVAVTGGLAIGLIAVRVTVVEDMKRQLAILEARNKERLALIERGLDPAIADKKKNGNAHGPLLWGLVFVGIAVGVLAGYLLSYYGLGEQYIMIDTMALLFGGISLLIYYRKSR